MTRLAPSAANVLISDEIGESVDKTLEFQDNGQQCNGQKVQ